MIAEPSRTRSPSLRVGALHARVVHEDAVARAGVDDDVRSPLLDEPRVNAREARLVERMGACGCPAERDLRAVEPADAPGPEPRHLDEDRPIGQVRDHAADAAGLVLVEEGRAPARGAAAGGGSEADRACAPGSIARCGALGNPLRCPARLATDGQVRPRLPTSARLPFATRLPSMVSASVSARST